MVICPFFLKKKAGPNFTRKGVTLIELVIVISFIGMLAVFVAGVIIPSLQIAKGRDARRKADLQKLKNPLDDYYNDKECYPSLLTELMPYYLKQIPIDPQTRQPYAYSSAGCDTYYVYTNLENTNDQSIAQVGCQSGCGPAGAYNYGVSSSNARLEATAPTTTPTQAVATPISTPGPTNTPTPAGPTPTNTPQPTPAYAWKRCGGSNPPPGQICGCPLGVGCYRQVWKTTSCSGTPDPSSYNCPITSNCSTDGTGNCYVIYGASNYYQRQSDKVFVNGSGWSSCVSDPALDYYYDTVEQLCWLPEGNFYGCISGNCTLLPGPVCTPNFYYPNCDPNGEYQCEDPWNECG